MRKKILIPLIVITVIVLILVVVRSSTNRPKSAVTPTPSRPVSLFPKEANEIFSSSVAENVDLNSGITIERLTSAIPEQINNVGFSVFNHTDEPIRFSNQGFGLTIFRYDEITNEWQNLPLRYAPNAEPTMLSPRIETWSDVDQTWAILEDETIVWGYDRIRIYVSGTGQLTNQAYGAYLDVTINLP
jgi:hypothetical protein